MIPFEIGELWFDDTQAPAEVKVRGAAHHYETLYDMEFDAVAIHPKTLNGEVLANGKLAGLTVIVTPTVLPHHFLLTNLEDPAGVARAKILGVEKRNFK